MNKINTSVFAIIQARMGSSRFPKKMLARLGPYTLIEWVFIRVNKTKNIDKVLLATSDLPRDDELVKIANKYNINVYRGSELDVLKRFYNAAYENKAKTIIRICADNPFIDPIELDRLINFYKENECDYAFNHQNKLKSNYADGFGAEIFSYNLLQKVNKIAKDPNHREHVTLYLWEIKTKYIVMPVPAPKFLNYPHLRFDIDLPKDKDKIESIINNGVTINSSAQEIVDIFLSGNYN